MEPIGVIQIVDTLNAGGMEKVAVNLANLLPRDRYDSHLCITRQDGPLGSLVSRDVSVINLERRFTPDPMALWRFNKYVRENRIRILHAHGTSLFFAAAASLLPPYPAVLWHDHYGRYRFDDRPVWLYRLAAHRAAGVIGVNHPLVEWSKSRLGIPEDRVWYLPNFVCEENAQQIPDLPGEPGSRIVCVANFRSEKDHLTLIKAMSKAVSRVPTAHLLLVGAEIEDGCLAGIRGLIGELALGRSVSILGQRKDVAAILSGCDIGVLSSASEGLPLSLLEYGMARLATVATEVGQCREVLDGGGAGQLVPPSDPELLARALTGLLIDPAERSRLARLLHDRVLHEYGPDSTIEKTCSIYEQILNRREGVNVDQARLSKRPVKTA